MHCVTLLVQLVQLVNTTLGTKTVASGDYMTHLVQAGDTNMENRTVTSEVYMNPLVQLVNTWVLKLWLLEII